MNYYQLPCFIYDKEFTLNSHFVLLTDPDLLSQSAGNVLIMAAHNHLTRQQGFVLIDSILRCIYIWKWDPVGELAASIFQFLLFLIVI